MRRPLPPAVAVAPFAQSLPTKTYSTIPRRRVSTAACPCLVQMPVRMGSLPSGPDAPKKVKNGKSHTTKRIHKIHTGTRSVGKHVAAPRKKNAESLPCRSCFAPKSSPYPPQVVFVVVVSASCKVLIPLYVAAQCDLALGRACPETRLLKRKKKRDPGIEGRREGKRGLVHNGRGRRQMAMGHRACCESHRHCKECGKK